MVDAFRRGGPPTLNRLHDVSSLASRLLKPSRISLERPVFIWCTARSGSHLLYDILSLHPGLATPSTTSRFKKGLFGSMHHGEDTPPQLRKQPIPVEGVVSAWEAAGLPPRFRGYLTAADAETLDVGALRDAYRAVARRWPWQRLEPLRLLDKSPRYLLMVELIEALFPDARHVFLVRDPSAVVNSILRILRERPEAREAYSSGLYGHMYPDGWEAWLDRPLVEQVCWQTATLLRHGLKSRERLGGRACQVLYEDLVKAPHAVVGGVFEAVGLSTFPDLEGFVPERLPNYSPAWPGASEPIGDRFGNDLFFTDEERGAFRALDGLVSQLGYPTPGIP